ncbi:glycoside hydrolase family 2 TIM barrel-domain containing protein [Hymenobacter sp. AT01-02]|uniref:glycoside hydrolase family 2 TIM barrel-domain containing protein n=1 Tax=Hymenobacter sp. AT01-02 TaxID=1571877 RepID=UPI0006E1D068|nr:glycoside hydrolase family 2 TIM barrel-domain containing protein [Hymenobacter sp. AT01-02]
MKAHLLLSLLTLSTVACAQTGPVKVEVKQTNGRYELLRGGKPYFIKGAGGGQFPERIKACGGNSIRTWTTVGGEKVLAEAHKNGLTVMMGLDVVRERHGFDYNDPKAVAEQLQRLRADVLRFKDSPDLLFWGIGNELNLEYTNPKVWDAVQQIAQMIHEVDPNHPTSTVLAGLNQQEVDYIKAKCPAVDILSINTYAGLASIPQQVRTTGWKGPYVVAEWPTGHWESPVTPWKASVEETSSQKAAVYQSRYEASVAKDKTQCLGTYVFLWGQKQERTPTWYGLFTEDGKESEVVDVMQYLWSGAWPKNRAPHLASFTLNNKQATDNVYLQPGQRYPAAVAVTDPNQDQLTYRWELLPESTDLKSGGDRESRPVAITGLIPAGAKAQTTLTAPQKEGAYRLFVYAYDGHDNVATANIPFYVQAK